MMITRLTKTLLGQAVPLPPGTMLVHTEDGEEPWTEGAIAYVPFVESTTCGQRAEHWIYLTFDGQTREERVSAVVYPTPWGWRCATYNRGFDLPDVTSEAAVLKTITAALEGDDDA